jgi:hypothetical protein
LSYDRPDTAAGQLQRGLGRGARAARDPELVSACLRHSYAWDWQVDARHVYLARLVRDLGMSVAPIVARLHAAEPELGDTEFTVTLGVLARLGQAGVTGVVDGVRDYVRDGGGWREALEQVAELWPVAWWDDLLPVVRDRIRDGNVAGEPWQHWARRDPGLPLAGSAAPAGRRPLVAWSTEELLAALSDPARRKQALRELAHRPAEPELLTVLETMDVTGPPGPIGRALVPLGAAAVPSARRWATKEGPLRSAAVSVLAQHGDDSDVPLLLAEVEAVDQHCGYDELVLGLARIGYPGLPDILRRIWLTPHSYERAAYLRAYLMIDPAGAEEWLVEGLWDCEEGVRELAVAHVPLAAEVRRRLKYLRDDPMEEPGVRGAAAARLAG